MDLCDRCGRQVVLEVIHASAGRMLVCTLCAHREFFGGDKTVEVQSLLATLYSDPGYVCGSCGEAGRSSHSEGCIVIEIEKLIGE